jgi:hypothetical protein
LITEYGFIQIPNVINKKKQFEKPAAKKVSSDIVITCLLLSDFVWLVFSKARHFKIFGKFLVLGFGRKSRGPLYLCFIEVL